MTKEEIIFHIQTYYKKFGKAPRTPNRKCLEYPELPYIRIVKMYFNSWNEALISANVPITMNTPKQKVKCICKNCGIHITKQPARIKVNNFCSKKCAGTFNSGLPKHKTFQSKPEKMIRAVVQSILPNESIIFNSRRLGVELDILLPNLQKAVEVNGICHYKPIYGKITFEKLQKRDQMRIDKCIENSIKLLVLDISQLSVYNETTMQPFYEQLKIFLQQV